MKELKAYVRIDRIDPIIHALKKVGVSHMSVLHVKAVGSSIDNSEARLSVELASPYTDMVKLEVVCPEARVEELISVIQQEGHTGRPGDGFIYVCPVDTAIRIRTGERDLDAILHEHS